MNWIHLFEAILHLAIGGALGYVIGYGIDGIERLNMSRQLADACNEVEQLETLLAEAKRCHQEVQSQLQLTQELCSFHFHQPLAFPFDPSKPGPVPFPVEFLGYSSRLP